MGGGSTGLILGKTLVQQGAKQAAKEAVKEAVEAATDIPTSKGKVGGETRHTKAGRLAHKEEPLPPGFKRDVPLKSGKRMDAYNKDTKEVIELKPNNPRAVKRGEKQVEGYCTDCNKEFGSGHKGSVQTYDPSKYLDK